MRLRSAPREVTALWRVSSRAADAYGGGRAAAALRARRLRREGGWTYEEALGAGLLDPSVPGRARRRYLSPHVREEQQSRLNPIALEPFSEEKLTLARYLTAVGVPVARTYGAVGRAGGWSAASGRIVTGREAFARMVRDELPRTWVVKPVAGYLGLSVRIVERDGEALRDSGGERLDPRSLYDALAADPDFDLFVIEERLRNGPELEALNPSPVLQTLRIVTLVRTDGTVRILFSWLKLAVGSGDSDSDNYRAGETGNGLANVRLEDGTLEPLLVPRADGLGPRRTAVVPGTGRLVEGWRVPWWEEAREVVTRAAPHLLPLRTLGWDVALTPTGPVVVEANNYWASSLVPMSTEAFASVFGP